MRLSKEQLKSATVHICESNRAGKASLPGALPFPLARVSLFSFLRIGGGRQDGIEADPPSPHGKIVILSGAKNLKLANRGAGPYFLSLDGRGLR